MWVYLGIKFDGDESYIHLKESLPQYSRIRVYILEPEFHFFEKTKEVSSNERLQITGERLTDGLRIMDYTVRIETRNCTVIDLTENELVCVIPEETELEDSHPDYPVFVHPGTNLSPQLIGKL